MQAIKRKVAAILRRSLGFLIIAVISHVLFATFIGPQAMVAVAQEAHLSEQDLLAYKARISQGTQTIVRLQTCGQALDARKQKMIDRNYELEPRLGALRRSEGKLLPKLLEAEKLAELRELNFKQEQKNYRENDEKLRAAQGEIAAIRRAIAKCKKDLGTVGSAIFGWSCDVAKELTGLRAREDKLRNAVPGLKKKLEISEKGLTEARQSLNQVKGESQKLSAEIKQVESEIQKTESELKDNKLLVSNIREETFQVGDAVNALKIALDEAESVNTSNDRSRTLRKMKRLSDELDKLIEGVPGILQKGAAQLSSGNSACAAA